MVALELGQATEADIAELLELRLGYLMADFGEISDVHRAAVERELPPYLTRHMGRDLHVFVARDERIVSCAWLLTVEKPPSPRFPHGRTGTLFNVYTIPERRRQGIAHQVMGLLIAAARNLDLDVVELSATDDGYPLYRSLGFDDDSSTHTAMRMVLTEG